MLLRYANINVKDFFGDGLHFVYKHPLAKRVSLQLSETVFESSAFGAAFIWPITQNANHLKLLTVMFA